MAFEPAASHGLPDGHGKMRPAAETRSAHLPHKSLKRKRGPSEAMRYPVLYPQFGPRRVPLTRQQNKPEPRHAGSRTENAGS